MLMRCVRYVVSSNETNATVFEADNHCDASAWRIKGNAWPQIRRRKSSRTRSPVPPTIVKYNVSAIVFTHRGRFVSIDKLWKIVCIGRVCRALMNERIVLDFRVTYARDILRGFGPVRSIGADRSRERARKRIRAFVAHVDVCMCLCVGFH